MNFRYLERTSVQNDENAATVRGLAAAFVQATSSVVQTVFRKKYLKDEKVLSKCAR